MQLNKRSWIRRRIGMKIEILPAADQLIAAAANGIYQGIIVTLVVALSLRLLGRTNAATRHAIWFCTLLLVASLMIAHCLRDYLAFAFPAAKTDLAAVPPFAAALPKSLESNGVIVESDASALYPELNIRRENPLEEASRSGSSSLLWLDSVRSASPIDAVAPQQSGATSPGPAVTGERLEASNVPSKPTEFRWLAYRLLNPISWRLALGP